MCQPRPEILELGTRDFLKKRLCILLGGKAAEALVYGEDHVSMGASADLQQGNKICQEMIAIHGMGDEELKNTVITSSSSFPLSSSRCSAMDRQIEEWMREAYEETRTILEKQRPMLNAMVEHLLMETTIYIDKDKEEEEDNTDDKSRKI
jgi:cell division protease FtsH